MNFNSHYALEGKHSFLSPSKYSWIRYDAEKLLQSFENKMEAALGTELHLLAAMAIKRGIKLADTQQTLNMYVNDAIGYRMTPEVILYVSENAFGSADAMWFGKPPGKRRNLLRIHDLKNGVSKASMDQLKIYAAYFCIEYDFKPHQLEVELRIYQNDYIMVEEPDPEEILHIMDVTKTFDKLITQRRMEAEL